MSSSKYNCCMEWESVCAGGGGEGGGGSSLEQPVFYCRTLSSAPLIIHRLALCVVNELCADSTTC